jgi:hypothetical protein
MRKTERDDMKMLPILLEHMHADYYIQPSRFSSTVWRPSPPLYNRVTNMNRSRWVVIPRTYLVSYSCDSHRSDCNT